MIHLLTRPDLYAGRCDVVLTDSTAVDYFNCH